MAKFLTFLFDSLSWMDIGALSAFLFIWLGTHFAITVLGAENSTHALMRGYRQKWMMEMLQREHRMVDASLLSSLHQSARFFASGTMVAVGGAIALLGKTDTLTMIADDLSLPSNTSTWEIKILLVCVILANSFLKFMWANRLFGYCSVLIGATPIDPNAANAKSIAEKAASINIYAARAFNSGLRSIYFALAAAAWLMGPEAFIGATLVTTFILLRREFASNTRASLMDVSKD